MKKRKIITILLAVCLLVHQSLIGHAEEIGEENITAQVESTESVDEQISIEEQEDESTISENELPEEEIKDSIEKEMEPIVENSVSANSVSGNEISISENKIVESKVFYEGDCGENVRFVFDVETSTLQLNGDGEMYEYHNFEELPWASYYDQINKIIIGNGIKGKLWYFVKKYYKN